MKKVAIIDMGSNTIKLLVASGEHHTVHNHFEAIEECRISEGISKEQPVLTEKAMDNGKNAISRLIEKSKPHHPHSIHLVATSAVRDAGNGGSYIQSIQNDFGCSAEILNGEQEAESIAKGLRFDPELEYLQDYIHFDLGGGSLECNHIVNRKLAFSTSMPLGAVRLTEKFVEDPKGPFTHQDAQNIQSAVRSNFLDFSIPMVTNAQPLVFTGGSATIARALLHHCSVASRDLGSNILLKTELMSLLAQLSPLNHAQRIVFDFLPENRADVVCAALQTLISVMELLEKQQLQHSLFSLRHGIAVKLLGLE